METSEIVRATADRVIHIGAPKCGSTALQEAFKANREAMRAAGVQYIGHQAHWVDAAKGAVGARDRVTGRPVDRAEWQKLLREVASVNGGTALISSEWFAGAPDDRVRAIVSELDAHRLHAVLLIRPLTRTLPSAWQQGLKLGGGERLAEWLEMVLHDPTSARSSRVWSKHRYDIIAKRWADALGPDRISVIVANEKEPNYIFSTFGELLGLPPGTLAAPPKRTNPSLSAFEADTLAELNNLYFQGGGTLRDYRSGVLRTFDGYVNSLRSGPLERSVIPNEQVEAVRRVNAEIAAGIRSIGCAVAGDLDQFAAAGQDASSADGVVGAAALAQRDADVRSAAGMIYALMVTTGIADPATPLPGFGGRAERLKHQGASLLRRSVRTALRAIRR